ncbi:MAG TPA: translocation/assembly module TamB domain-containing protein [Acidobacteriota bacterium]|nr:translocation/assembly module TamB domain-containing protein [Acidobacteriota bacterium]
MNDQEPTTRRRKPANVGGARPVWFIVSGVVLLATLLVLFGGVGVVTALFASGDSGLSRRVVAVANALIASDSTRFACERVRGTLFRGAILDRPRLLVQAPGREVTWAEARSARIEYDLFALLFNPRRAFTVELDSLRVVLGRDTTGALVLPRFRAGRGGDSNVSFRIALTLRDASIAFEREGFRFADLDGSGTVESASEGSTVVIDRLQGTATGAERSVPVRMRGAVAMRGSVWRVDPLDVTLGQSRFDVAADWDRGRGRLRDGTLKLAPLVLDEALPLFDVEGVTGTLRGDVAFEGLPHDGIASGCLEGTLAGEAIDTLIVRAVFEPKEIRFDGLHTRLRGATLSGTGRIDPVVGLDAAVRFHDADPANLPWWKAPAGVPHGSIAGDARVRITRAKPRPAVTVQGTVLRSRVGRLSIDRADFIVHAPPPGGIRIDSLRLQSPGARLEGSGVVDAKGTLSASAVATIQDLGRMAALLDPAAPRAGSGRVAATLGGTLEKPTLEARGVLQKAEFGSGLRADTLTVVAAGALAPTLAVEGTVRAAGFASRERALGDVWARYSGGRTLRVHRFVQSLGDTTLTLTGLVQFEGGGARAEVDSLRLEAGALRAAGTGRTEVTFARGRLRASPVTLDLLPGRLDADVDWDVTNGVVDIRGLVDGLDLARISRRPDPRFAGTLRAQFLVSGKSSDPEASLNVAITAPRLGGIAADSLRGKIEYAPGVVTVESFSWRRGPSSIAVRGTLRTRRPLEVWLREAARGETAWRGETTLALEADADSLDLAPFARADTTWRSLEGSVTAHARIGGTLAEPTAAITGRAPRLRIRGVEGSVVAGTLDYRDRTLRIERLDLKQGDGATSVVGHVPYDLSPFAEKRWRKEAPLALSIRMDDADLAILPALTSLVAASTGRVSGNAEVTGTPGKPRITGEARLRDGRIRFAGRYEVLEDVTVEGTFDEERLTLTKIEARQGKRGRLTGTGWWRWAGATPLPAGSVGPWGTYQLQLKATDCVTTDREYYLFQFTGDFQVANGATTIGIVKPKVTGSGVVSRGELTINLAAPVGEPRPAMPFLYDVTAEFPRQLKYRQLDTEVDLAGTLRLRNEGGRDIALGTLTVQGGQFYFLTRKFRDLSGQVNFNDVNRLDPDVALDASTRIRRGDDERIINLAITGRASQMQIRPWDEDGSSPTELWRELSLGQFSAVQGPTDLTGGDSENAAFGEVAIRGYLFRNAERWISSSGFIDTIDLQSGAGQRRSDVGGAIDLGAVGVGKYVTRDLFLKYSRDFSGATDQSISAEYRVTRHLLLRGQQIQRSSTTARTGGTQEYNLDLKIRVEY